MLIQIVQYNIYENNYHFSAPLFTDKKFFLIEYKDKIVCVQLLTSNTTQL